MLTQKCQCENLSVVNITLVDNISSGGVMRDLFILKD